VTIQVLGGDLGHVGNIVVISQGLSGEGLAPEDSPPALDQIQPDSAGFSRIQPDSAGFSRIQPDSAGFSQAAPTGRKACWMRLDAPGCAWMRLDAPGCAWMRLDAPGCAWMRGWAASHSRIGALLEHCCGWPGCRQAPLG
jgi:hypothetical protein